MLGKQGTAHFQGVSDLPEETDSGWAVTLVHSLVHQSAGDVPCAGQGSRSIKMNISVVRNLSLRKSQTAGHTIP